MEEGKSMAKNQTIRCSVHSCRFHKENMCELESIEVRPKCDCHSGTADESMCGSYQCCCK